MNKLALLVPLGLLAAGIYLFVLAMAPGETVQVIPGNEIPDRIAMLLGGVMIVGAIVVSVEALRAANGAPRG